MAVILRYFNGFSGFGANYLSVVEVCHKNVGQSI